MRAPSTRIDFYAFTYPTCNLRKLAMDVVLRMIWKNFKAVGRLELS